MEAVIPRMRLDLHLGPLPVFSLMFIPAWTCCPIPPSPCLSVLSGKRMSCLVSGNAPGIEISGSGDLGS